MPEGDTVYKLAAALRPQLVGQRIKRAIVRTPRAGHALDIAGVLRANRARFGLRG